MSYYANSKQFFFVQTELDQVIRSLHDVIGNAVTEGRHIVIGVGSTQLFQAALYALSPPDRATPTKVVSVAPFYSWAGDASVYRPQSDDSYIELVTTPNNPTGEVRQSVVSGGAGFPVHDLAYYWPHHTPITSPADHDLMLFTVSKSTGHAGTRIGWALVKDLKVAQKMAKFIELNTIGVSKDAQIRAAHILRAVTRQYRELGGKIPYTLEKTRSGQIEERIGAKQLFHFAAAEMSYRWQRLRSVLTKGTRFSVPEFQPAWCTFFGEIRSPAPDCEEKHGTTNVDERDVRTLRVTCNKSRKHLVAASLPNGEFAPDGSVTPKSWITTSFILNGLFLMFVLLSYMKHDTASPLKVAEIAIPAAICPASKLIEITANDPCSGHGVYEVDFETEHGTCRCHSCFSGRDCSATDDMCVIDLYQ
ncbi:hypothetical protein AXG93_2998s1000 [Marchantia polymorpha subsp. ruderalis]|uniref:EGF-like domain-containing protein n=1 Tax=Marchantia polymorpha subsp. ruderalis TaxID=1480154 RepID=A0A176VLI8_MARPO|nr:hypothetical protein AXG93_2998s1000 [Marchantia polymorpha subsp. ruderalis]